MTDEELKRQADSDWIDHTDSPYERYLELKLARTVKQRDELLALLSDIDELLAEWNNLGYINYGKMKSCFDTDLERIELRIEEAVTTLESAKECEPAKQ